VRALDAALLFAAAAAGGGMNALAGGGTILTFPTLLLLGVPAVTANATSTVALLPGAAASLAGYRREVATHRHWLTSLLLPSLAGGALGAFLLLATPDRIFARLAPWLILFATALFFLQSLAAFRRRTAPRALAPELAGRHLRIALVAQLGVAIYGGYFGAGIGILMLVILGYLGLEEIHAMNGLKNFFGICINSVAAAIFIARGAVDWPLALVMLAGAVVGGYAGANFGRWIGPAKARGAVILIGVVLAVVLWIQQR